MYRITEKMLENQVRVLNNITGNEPSPYTKGQGGANINTFLLDHAYGGVALYQICNEGGGVNDIFNNGHMTKRELHGRIDAFIKGIEYKN